MTFLDLLIYGLACFRLSLLVSKEDGPAWVFRKLRHLPPPKSSARQGLSCIFCVSVYAASLSVAAYMARTEHPCVEPFFVWPLALSSFAIVVNQTWTKGAL
jgi:hypothetical protein